jgi:hypothetical protein
LDLGLDLNLMLGLQLLLLTSMLEVQRKKIEKVELLEKIEQKCKNITPQILAGGFIWCCG